MRDPHHLHKCVMAGNMRSIGVTIEYIAFHRDLVAARQQGPNQALPHVSGSARDEDHAE